METEKTEKQNEIEADLKDLVLETNEEKVLKKLDDFIKKWGK